MATNTAPTFFTAPDELTKAWYESSASMLRNAQVLEKGFVRERIGPYSQVCVTLALLALEEHPNVKTVTFNPFLATGDERSRPASTRLFLFRSALMMEMFFRGKDRNIFSLGCVMPCTPDVQERLKSLHQLHRCAGLDTGHFELNLTVFRDVSHFRGTSASEPAVFGNIVSQSDVNKEHFIFTDHDLSEEIPGCPGSLAWMVTPSGRDLTEIRISISDDAIKHEPITLTEREDNI